MFYRSRLCFAVAVLTLLGGCDKPAAPVAGKSVAEKPASVERQPFVRTGETLTVNVDGMPRQAFLAKLGELTGAQITAEGDSSQPVTVHASDASLRQVLGLALADAPYAVTMQFANLQDSFPASVSVTRYQGAAVAPAPAPSTTVATTTQQPVPEAVEPVMTQEPEAPDFATMPHEEREEYFLKQSDDDQVALIFDMEPTAEDTRLIADLIGRDRISHEVKMEMLDSLSNGDYANSLPALKVAFDSSDNEVVTRAVEVLGELGSDTDIPTLKKIVENHADEEVKQAARDAIEFLSP